MAESQFEKGHEIPPHEQERPGKQGDMKDPKPVSTQIPTEDGGYQKYRAAGKLEGKKAIITGGDSGIGRAIAILFAMEGADSLIAYLPDEEEDAQETKRRVEEHGGKCYLLATDIKQKENCKKIVDAAIDRLGGVNILVNNAGTQLQVEKIKDLSEHTWEDTFATNINPVFYLSKYVMPHLKSGDTIINNASINAYVGRPDLLDYTSTKGAIVAFTRGLSNQVAGDGIRVNCVCPGPVWTPLIPATMSKEAQKQFHQTPMGRAGQPSEIATCFVFLASQDSSFISGQSLHPNGGVVVNG